VWVTFTVLHPIILSTTTLAKIKARGEFEGKEIGEKGSDRIKSKGVRWEGGTIHYPAPYYSKHNNLYAYVQMDAAKIIV